MDLNGAPADGVNNSLNRGNTSDMAVENVKGGETPPSQPKEDVVPAREHPDKRQIGVRDDTCPIRNISPRLDGFGIAIMYSIRRDLV